MSHGTGHAFCRSASASEGAPELHMCNHSVTRCECGGFLWVERLGRRCSSILAFLGRGVLCCFWFSQSVRCVELRRLFRHATLPTPEVGDEAGHAGQARPLGPRSYQLQGAFGSPWSNSFATLLPVRVGAPYLQIEWRGREPVARCCASFLSMRRRLYDECPAAL